MEYYLVISSIVIFVENRLQGKLDYGELEEATGFSLAHVRDVFAKLTGKPLYRYILERKIANAAFELLHSKKGILDIAMKYGFSNPDTFTRAFNRVTGVNPQDFRKQRYPVGRIKLCAGVYGVGILKQDTGEEVVK